MKIRIASVSFALGFFISSLFTYQLALAYTPYTSSQTKTNSRLDVIAGEGLVYVVTAVGTANEDYTLDNSFSYTSGKTYSALLSVHATSCAYAETPSLYIGNVGGSQFLQVMFKGNEATSTYYQQGKTFTGTNSATFWRFNALNCAVGSKVVVHALYENGTPLFEYSTAPPDTGSGGGTIIMVSDILGNMTTEWTCEAVDGVTTCGATATTSVSLYNGPSYHEWLYIAGIIIFLLSYLIWKRMSVIPS